MEAVSLGREGMIAKHRSFMNEALQDMDMGSQDSKNTVMEFSATIQKLMPLEHWNSLLKILHIEAINETGAHFNKADVEIQKRWKVELKRMGFFLSPILRQEVQLHPHFFPELAIVMSEYRKVGEEKMSIQVEVADQMRKISLLRKRLDDKTIAPEDFRRMVVELVELLGIQREAQIVSAISVMMEPGEMDDYVRDFVLQCIDTASGTKK